jgi:SSS family transporter
LRGYSLQRFRTDASLQSGTSLVIPKGNLRSTQRGSSSALNNAATRIGCSNNLLHCEDKHLTSVLAASIPGSITRLSTFDLALVVLYLIGITLFGLRFRGGRGANGKVDKSLKNYFLAGNTIPWWAIGLSIVSAETSTLTIISIPGVAFAGDFGFLQVVFGYMLGRIVVALIFLPKYFQGELMTAYQLIDNRFGHTLHKVTALLFLLTRAAAEGVRVFAVSIVVGIAIGTRDVLSIAIISALTLLYTFEGGMAAVIWTDVVQMAIYVGGTIVAISTLGQHVPGGWTEIHRVASLAGKFRLFHFALNLTQSYTFWAGLIGGTFLTMASHGTDQLMVQRMLAAKNLRESRLALLGSGVVILMQFTLFLLIGVGLYVFYGLHPGVFASADRIFPTFIVREMPIGIAGLMVAAILAAAMSNLSAALNSLSSTTVVDFYMSWRPAADDRERIMISRASTVMWALVLFAIAVYSIQVGGKGHVVEIGLSIASVAYGALLGVFLLGTLTKYATQTGAIIGMVVGFALNVALWQQPHAIVLSNSLTLPKVAFTWYVLIGSAVTFAVGSLASLVFPAKRRVAIAAATVLALTLHAITTLGAPHLDSEMWKVQPQDSKPDFTPITTLIDDAIADKKLPGAVVVIGHNGKVVFEHAYGNRKLAGEPGVNGELAAEPMTEDTIFDMASLTKCLATATAIMQLYELHKLDFDDPVAKYIPEFAANGKQNVTIRELLTHYSGLPPDVDLKDPWGLAAPDKAEGLRRAFASQLVTTPGTHFEYSDINYITLGALVEKLSGETLDAYARKHIFQPLGMMDTTYHQIFGDCSGDSFEPSPYGHPAPVKPPHPCTNSANSLTMMLFFAKNPRTAPTAHDNEGTAQTNFHYDVPLRGTVHDPTTRRMGGVAGQAGVFSTAADISRFAQALLDKLIRNTGPFPLQQSTLKLMTTPEQPATAESTATIFTPDGKPTKGIALRGFGWDINSAFSRPRGEVFPIGSFGHTGFTGTSLWMDPASDSYVILLANAIHPRGNPPISTLRGQVATAAAKALGFSFEGSGAASHPSESMGGAPNSPGVQTGIDVLEATNFAAIKSASKDGHLRIGLLTNQTGLDAHGHRTIDILKSAPGVELTTLFSPEHGIAGAKDSTDLHNSTDAATGLPILSLYGPKDADKRPKLEDLKQLDAVVIDLQDAGVRFYTYESVMGYFLEACSRANTPLFVLDRPDPIGGELVQGPVSDPGKESYINYRPEPISHGMTLGELAQFDNAEGHLNARLTIIPMQNWRREEYFDQTGLQWVNPSPNLRSIAAARLYPGIGLMDYANVSVGRGTDTPFEHIGAAYIDGPQLAAYLISRKIAGVTITSTKFKVADDENHYPFHGQEIEGVALAADSTNTLDAPELGIELIAALHKLYPEHFALKGVAKLIASDATSDALEKGTDPREIAASWQPALAAFKARRARYLLYK